MRSRRARPSVPKRQAAAAAAAAAIGAAGCTKGLKSHSLRDRTTQNKCQISVRAKGSVGGVRGGRCAARTECVHLDRREAQQEEVGVGEKK